MSQNFEQLVQWLFTSLFKILLFDNLCPQRRKYSLVQNCLDDQLHPGSSGIQTHFSAIFQSSSTSEEKKKKKERQKLNGLRGEVGRKSELKRNPGAEEEG